MSATTTAPVAARVLVRGFPKTAYLRQPFRSSTLGLRAVTIARCHPAHGVHNGVRLFSTSQPHHITEFFPPQKSTKHVIETETSFEHPVYVLLHPPQLLCQDRSSYN
jgi:hypothetical protein